MYWISYYNSYSNGYNATIGGDGKSYLDTNKIEELYKIEGSALKVSEITGNDYCYICDILKSKGYDLLNKSNSNKQIAVFSPSLNIKFESATKASEYLVKLLNKNCIPSFYNSHITACCKNKRRTVLGNTFEYC